MSHVHLTLLPPLSINLTTTALIMKQTTQVKYKSKLNYNWGSLRYFSREMEKGLLINSYCVLFFPLPLLLFPLLFTPPIKTLILLMSLLMFLLLSSCAHDTGASDTIEENMVFYEQKGQNRSSKDQIGGTRTTY